MFLKNVKLVNFRNYDQLFINLNSKINIIYGDNAQGKTNLLESIYFLALTKSHRSLNDISLIKNNSDFFMVSALCNIDNIDKKFEITLKNNKKKYYIDDDEIKSLSDYISNIKIIIFFPDDLELIKSSPDTRRHYINIQISQLDKNYFKILSDYNKLLKIRNELLKNNLKEGKLDENYYNIITNYLIEKASYIYIMRKKYLSKINDYLNDIFFNLSGISNFNMKYITNTKLIIDSRENLVKQLSEKFIKINDAEKKVGTTLIGPHRDDIEFDIMNDNLKTYGSQGQQRMAILAMKLAEIEIFKKQNNDTPILLLDDVFSELDLNKKNNLLKYINSNIQTIITTTDLDNLDKTILNNASIFKIENGKII